MSITRKMLKGMGLTEEQVDTIIEEHTSVTNSLKERADLYDATKTQLEDAQKELSALKANDKGDAYDKLKKEFEDYKADVAAKAERTAKENALKEILKDIGINEKHFSKILKYSDYSFELDKDGKPVNAKDIRNSLKEEWADHITTTEQKAENPENPPEGNKSGFDAMTLSQKMQYANEHPADPDVLGWLKK